MGSCSLAKHYSLIVESSKCTSPKMSKRFLRYALNHGIDSCGALQFCCFYALFFQIYNNFLCVTSWHDLNSNGKFSFSFRGKLRVKHK